MAREAGQLRTVLRRAVVLLVAERGKRRARRRVRGVRSMGVQAQMMPTFTSRPAQRVAEAW